MKNRFLIGSIIILFVLVVVSGVYAFKLRENYLNSLSNNYNRAFGEAVNCINNVENFLAKAQITKTKECSIDNLTKVWNDANLAMIYLSEIPFDNEGAINTIKFLNQVSDYSYSLTRKNINNIELDEKDFENLKELYAYSKDLESVLNVLSDELYSGSINWNELQNGNKLAYAQEVGSIDSMSNIDSTFDKYEGLIYDGAYSEHLNRKDKKYLNKSEITKEEAEENAKQILNNDFKKWNYNGEINNSDIQMYLFEAVKENDEIINLAITKKGGYLIQMNNSRNVNKEKISQNDANEIGKKFLKNIGFINMKETYFTKIENILTINYAFVDNDVICYPDLIKVKVALDNGEILGVESSGFLNCHEERNFVHPQVSMENAEKNLNPKLSIKSKGVAIIPLEDGSEKLCYEFKGNVEDKEFLVYVNVETGKEENILIILETEGGTLTI